MHFSVERPFATGEEIRRFLFGAAIADVFAKLTTAAFDGVRVGEAALMRLETEAVEAIRLSPSDFVASGAEPLLPPALDRAERDVRDLFDFLRAARNGRH